MGFLKVAWVRSCADPERAAIGSADTSTVFLAAEGLSVAAALDAVQAVRPCALPNEGFMRQLREYAFEQQRQLDEATTSSSAGVC